MNSRSKSYKETINLYSDSTAFLVLSSVRSLSLSLCLSPSVYVRMQCFVSFNEYIPSARKPQAPKLNNRKLESPGPRQLDHWPKTQEQPTVSAQLRSASHSLCTLAYIDVYTQLYDVYAYACMYV